MTNKKTQRRDVPEAALTFKASDFGFTTADESGRVRMLARSSQPIDHWFWGRIVHDLAGVNHKDRIVLDYNHDPDQIIGYLDQFQVTDEGLEATGRLVSFTDGDRAAEITHKSSQGVPYEASINFGGSGIKLEEVADGDNVLVNGYQFDGPGVVVREWPFRGCAVCPYGADENTESEVFRNGDNVVVEVLTGEENMTENNERQFDDTQVEDAIVDEELTEVAETETDDLVDEVVDEDVVEEVTEEAVVELSDHDIRGECARFISNFGPDGGLWFAEGLSFEEAQDRHMSGVIQERDDLREEIEALKSQLAAVSRGEADALEFTVAHGDDNGERVSRINGYRSQVGSLGAAAFAARFESSKE
jgi:hypothetical protein